MSSDRALSATGTSIHCPGDEPIPWAIFRCSHDAFRTALNEMEYLLTQEEAWRKESFPTLWARYQKFLQLHSDMEDYGFFPLLDKVSNKSFSHNGFWEEHQNEVSSAMKVDRAIDLGRQSGNWSKVLEAYRLWQKAHIQHLEHEEEVWESYLDRFGSTLQERCQLVNQEVITPMDQHDHNLCLQYYSWIVRYLSTFGAVHQTPKDATVMFVRGLRSVCSAQQWARFMPAVHAVCDDSVWQFLLTNYSIHSADPIASQLFGSGFVTTDHSNAPSGRATPAESEHRASPDKSSQRDSAVKTTRASFLYTLSQPAVKIFSSFYGAELEPSIIQSADFPPGPTNEKLHGEEKYSASHGDSKNSPNKLVPMVKTKSIASMKTKPQQKKAVVAARSIVASKAIQSSVWSRASSSRSDAGIRSWRTFCCSCFGRYAAVEDDNEDPLPPSPRNVETIAAVSDAVEPFVAPVGRQFSNDD